MKLKYDINIDLNNDNEFSLHGINRLKRGYMLPTEQSPQERFAYVASEFASNAEHAQRMYEHMSSKRYSNSTPVLAFGRNEKGLPISCFKVKIDDSAQSLIDSSSETRWMTVGGGGVGIYLGMREPGPKSTGAVFHTKTYDSDVLAYKQAETRRGAISANMDINHPEIVQFIDVRTPTGGDVNQKSLNMHICVNLTDDFMNRIDRLSSEVLTKEEHDELDRFPLISPEDGKTVTEYVSAKFLWQKILDTRVMIGGEPFIHFIDHSNAAMPQYQKDLGLRVNQTNLCCVAGDQRVVTDRGILTVKELYDLGGTNKVPGLAEEGVVDASAMLLPRPDAPMVQVNTKEGYTHKVTPDHRIRVKDKGWVEAQDLVEGDKILLQQDYSLHGPVHNPKLGLVAGLIAGDGTYSDTGVHIDLWQDKTYSLTERVESYVEDLLVGQTVATSGVLDPKFKERADCKAKRLSSAALKRVLAEHGITKEVKVSVPEFVWNGDVETKQAFLEGLYASDGTMQLTKEISLISISSTNRQFLQDLQVLWASLGVKSSLTDAGSQAGMTDFGAGGTYYTNQVWRLIISSIRGCKIALEATKLHKYRNNYDPDLLSAMLNKAGYAQKMHATFTHLTELPNEDAYCLTVDSDTHAWTVNGMITHNTEIMLGTGNDALGKRRSAVCCLGSINASKIDDIMKDDETLYQYMRDIMEFLDNVLQKFIDLAKDRPGYEHAVYSASRERAIGIGMLGWHDYLQSKHIPFDSAIALETSRQIWEKIHSTAMKINKELAAERGACPDSADSDNPVRFSHVFAIAPNASSAIIMNTSPSTEMRRSNAYVESGDVGTYTVKNPRLEAYLDKIGHNTAEVWDSIVDHDGSVQHLDFLSDWDKSVFATAFEVDPVWTIEHAAVRQPYVCQGQSTNLFIALGTPIEKIAEVHLLAWKKKLKSLYYCRSASATRANVSQKIKAKDLEQEFQQDGDSACVACE